MTEKEKATELIEKFRIHSQACIFDGDTLFSFDQDTQTESAKQCALICVEEILNEFPRGVENSFERKRFNFWQQVKQQIQNE